MAGLSVGAPALQGAIAVSSGLYWAAAVFCIGFNGAGDALPLKPRAPHRVIGAPPAAPMLRAASRPHGVAGAQPNE
jgi:hypothetical protein